MTPYTFWKVANAAVIVGFTAGRIRAGTLVGALLGSAAFLALGVGDLRLGFFGRSVWRGKRNSRCISLTFDDGPDPDLTPEILKILDKYGMTATFFVVGDRAEARPDLVRAIFERGHTVGCHDLHHTGTENFRLYRRAYNQIQRAGEILHGIIGYRPQLYRPPVGLMNPHIARALEDLDLTCIGWSSSAGDRGNRRMAGIRQIGRLGRPGDIVLLHDRAGNPGYIDSILAQVDILCARITSLDLKGVPVDRLTGISPYRRLPSTRIQ
jgi:peptidoglycan/xylan/chitin deacetylase (PgdA/CDA1 family)